MFFVSSSFSFSFFSSLLFPFLFPFSLFFPFFFPSSLLPTPTSKHTTNYQTIVAKVEISANPQEFTADSRRTRANPNLHTSHVDFLAYATEQSPGQSWMAIQTTTVRPWYFAQSEDVISIASCPFRKYVEANLFFIAICTQLCRKNCIRISICYYMAYFSIYNIFDELHPMAVSSLVSDDCTCSVDFFRLVIFFGRLECFYLGLVLCAI